MKDEVSQNFRIPLFGCKAHEKRDFIYAVTFRRKFKNAIDKRKQW